jgi:2,3-bisphosphoglycerate-dependent phosphoglycerate mutase
MGDGAVIIRLSNRLWLRSPWQVSVGGQNFIGLSLTSATLPLMVHGTPAGEAVSEVADAHRVVWLVRHGESTWNAAGLAQGHCDRARLTQRGEHQARDVAGRLRERPIGALYASDLRRALATAAPLASVLGLAVARDLRLRERCLGDLEGGSTAAVTPAVSGINANRVVDPDARPPGGESLRDFYRRVAGFVADLERQRLPGLSRGPDGAGEIVVVAHGGTLRMLNACLRGVPVGQMGWEPLGNACILRSRALVLS